MAEKERRESPGFLKKVKEFKENPPDNPYSRFAYKYLFNRLKTYLQVIRANNLNKKKAEAEIYRHLVRYMLEVQEHIEDSEKKLEELLGEGEIVFFPSEQESVEKINGKIQITLVAKNKTNKWIKAYKEYQENS